MAAPTWEEAAAFVTDGFPVDIVPGCMRNFDAVSVDWCFPEGWSMQVLVPPLPPFHYLEVQVSVEEGKGEERGGEEEGGRGGGGREAAEGKDNGEKKTGRRKKEREGGREEEKEEEGKQGKGRTTEERRRGGGGGGRRRTRTTRGNGRRIGCRYPPSVPGAEI